MSETTQDFYTALEVGLNEDYSKTLGKHRNDDDFAIAVSKFQKEQQELLDSFKLAKAIKNDRGMPAEVLKKFRHEDIQEAQDRQVALRLSGKIQTRANADTLEIDKYFEKLNISTSKPPSSGVKLTRILPNVPNAIATHTSKSHRLSTPKQCNSCLEERVGTFSLDCSHFYCLPCLQSLANGSLRDRSYVPVRCCKVPIPFNSLKECFTNDEFIKYEGFLITQREAVANLVALDAKMEVLIKFEGLKVCVCGAVVEKFTGYRNTSP